MTVQMPFGKHRDKPISEIPTRYLKWVVREAQLVDDAFRAAVLAELHGRPDADIPCPDDLPQMNDLPGRGTLCCERLRWLENHFAETIRLASAGGMACPELLHSMRRVCEYLGFVSRELSPRRFLERDTIGAR